MGYVVQESSSILMVDSFSGLEWIFWVVCRRDLVARLDGGCRWTFEEAVEYVPNDLRVGGSAGNVN